MSLKIFIINLLDFEKSFSEIIHYALNEDLIVKLI